MARKSLQQLEEEAKRRTLEVSNNHFQSKADPHQDKPYQENNGLINGRAVSDVMQSNQTLHRYKLPEQINSGKILSTPKINPDDYPEINVRGSFPVDRQKRGANLLLLKEIDKILEEIDVGNNRNATLNFLIWVGLQTLKGMSNRIDVKINENTFADGGIVTEFDH